jgi:hypothetical protein
MSELRKLRVAGVRALSPNSYQPLPPPPPPPPPEEPPLSLLLLLKPLSDEPPLEPGGEAAAAMVSPSDETELLRLLTEKPEPLSEEPYQVETACATAAAPIAMTKRSAQVFSTSSATA